jgi:hypothetical protein
MKKRRSSTVKITIQIPETTHLLLARIAESTGLTEARVAHLLLIAADYAVNASKDPVCIRVRENLLLAEKAHAAVREATKHERLRQSAIRDAEQALNIKPPEDPDTAIVG